MSELSDLMAKDPLLLTKEDVTSIVQYHRENRERHVAGIKLPKEKAAPAGPVDLSVLDIKL